jgi:hypothetical protein
MFMTVEGLKENWSISMSVSKSVKSCNSGPQNWANNVIPLELSAVYM